MPIHTGSVSLSENGQWGLAEWEQYGFVRFQTAHPDRLQRVTAPGISYGWNNESLHETAISNDGSAIVSMGRTAGLEMWSVDDSCGDIPSSNTQYYYSQASPCAVVPIDRDALHPGFYYAEQPQFSSDGRRLMYIVHHWSSDSEHFVLGAYGTETPSLDTLALGDSFTSGEGETSDARYLPLTNTGIHRCHVSDRSYPYLLQPEAAVHNAACSGARIRDIQGGAGYVGQQDRLNKISSDERQSLRTQALEEGYRGILPQREFLNYHLPGLTLVGVGGNDAGLAAKLAACAMPGTCSWAGDPQKRAATADEISRLETKLRALYAELRQLHPGGELYVVGYPSIINDAIDASCDPVTATMYSLEERRYINASIRLLNQTLLRAADAAGVPFIDLYGALDGERLCDTELLAVNGLRFGTEIGPIKTIPLFNIIGSESFHPTPRGHERIADAIRTRLAQLFGGETGDLYDPDEYWQGLPPKDAAYHYEALVPSHGYQIGDELVVSVNTTDIRASSEYRVSFAGSELETGAVGEGGSIVGSLTVPAVEPGTYELEIEAQTVAGEPIVLYDLVSVTNASMGFEEGVEPDDGSDTLPVTVQSTLSGNSLNSSVTYASNPAIPAVLGSTIVNAVPAPVAVAQRPIAGSDSTALVFVATALGIGLLGTVGAYLLVKRSRNRGG